MQNNPIPFCISHCLFSFFIFVPRTSRPRPSPEYRRREQFIQRPVPFSLGGSDDGVVGLAGTFPAGDAGAGCATAGPSGWPNSGISGVACQICFSVCSSDGTTIWAFALV